MHGNPRPEYEELAGLPRARLETVADTGFRDRDPEGHLRRLQAVLETIFWRMH